MLLFMLCNVAGTYFFGKSFKSVLSQRLDYLNRHILIISHYSFIVTGTVGAINVQMKEIFPEQYAELFPIIQGTSCSKEMKFISHTKPKTALALSGDRYSFFILHASDAKKILWCCCVKQANVISQANFHRYEVIEKTNLKNSFWSICSWTNLCLS